MRGGKGRKNGDAKMRDQFNRKKDRCSGYAFVVSCLVNVFLFILHKDRVLGINHVLSALEVHFVCKGVFVTSGGKEALYFDRVCILHPQIQISWDKENLLRCSRLGTCEYLSFIIIFVMMICALCPLIPLPSSNRYGDMNTFVSSSGSVSNAAPRRNYFNSLIKQTED